MVNFLQGDQTEVRLTFEPDNIQDRNTIRVEVHLDQDWHIIGYIPVPKIKKFTKAIRRGELRYVELKDRPQMELQCCTQSMLLD